MAADRAQGQQAGEARGALQVRPVQHRLAGGGGLAGHRHVPPTARGLRAAGRAPPRAGSAGSSATEGPSDYQCLWSLPGVASVLAMVILAEGGDLRRFGHHRQFLKYCGLDLAKCQSGQFRGRETLSKRGNARLRMAFWMAAQRAVRITENSFRDKYERYVKQDPGNADVRRKALTAVAAKMARVA